MKIEVHYSYPTSPSAIELGHGSTGCYTVETWGTDNVGSRPFRTLQDALDFAATLPGERSRWSLELFPQLAAAFHNHECWPATC